MSLLLALTGSTPSITAALSWREEDDVCAIAVTVGAVVSFAGGGAIFPPGWYGKNRQRREVAELEQLFESAPPVVQSAIKTQSRTRLESMEADEKAIRAAAEAARIEWDAFYMRLLAYQREEALIEEEAIVMTMFAVLSE